MHTSEDQIESAELGLLGVPFTNVKTSWMLNVACINLVFQNQSRTTSIKPNTCSVGLSFLYKSSEIMLRRDFK